MTKKKTVAEATAKPSLPVSKLKPAEMVTLTAQRSQVVKSAPGYGAAGDVQKAITSWDAASDVIAKGEQAIEAAKLTLAALLVTQVGDIATWQRATQAVLSAIAAASAGSAAAIQQWGFSPATRAEQPVSDAAPGNLHATYNKQLALVLRWAGVRGHIGYFVQLGDGTPTGWAAPVACPRVGYAPPGLTPGQKLAARVAVQRKSGLSAWSDAVSITVR